MKLAVVTLLAFSTLTAGRSVDFGDLLEETTAYGYLQRYGVPLANIIREAEEAELSDSGRVAGGSVSGFGQFPYQAGLVIQLPFNLQGVCGGSVLTNNRVLTAAHCWWDGQFQAQRFTVVLGSNRLFSGGVRLDTRDVVMHGDWWPNIVRSDVAMIRLPRNSIIFNNVIQPIVLPSGTQLNEHFSGQRATASGFGRNRDGVPIPSGQVLHHVVVDVIGNDVCTRTPGIGRFVHTSNICTSGAGGRGICPGDSGGPLAITRNNRPLLIGITSFFHRDGCQSGFPSVYARVTSFNTWIRRNL